MNISATIVFTTAEDFLDSIPEPDKGKLITAMEMVHIDIELVHVKTLKTPIKELKVKKYRILFFIKNNVLYFTNGFIKKSQKTPKSQIEYAEKIFKMIK